MKGLSLILLVVASLTHSLDLGSTRSRSGTRARFGVNTTPKKDKFKVSIAVVMPHSLFKKRDYKKIISQSALELTGSKFEKMFDLSPYLEMVHPIPAPIDVLGKICDQVSVAIFGAWKVITVIGVRDSLAP